jgi:alkanesulfonate monooxygenase SsuD/methylene tetrahydromethanopterin reductase-like flavin-dependent oxidoreductase (luciferase family)
MAERMKIGLVLPTGDGEAGGRMPDYRLIRSLARSAEAAGLDSIWVSDHLVVRFPGEPETGVHEGWTVLSALAEATSRVELGTIVLCSSFRNPALTAKMAAALDAVSGGRLILGLGCGWHDPEYEAFGFPTDHRVGRFAEALTIIKGLLAGERVTLAGTYHAAADAVLLPPPARSIPILVAAVKPRMLELTVSHADQWNTAWYAEPDDRLVSRRAALAAALEAAGRNPGSLTQTVGVRMRPAGVVHESPPGPGALFTGDATELAALLDTYEGLGFGHVIAWIDPTTPETLDWLVEAVRVHRERSPAG